MIFFISDGRLGNQAFQYAFLNTKAKTNEKVICVNMSQIANYFDFKNQNFIFLSSSRLALFLYKNAVAKILTFLVRLKVIGCIEQLRVAGTPMPEVSKIKGIIPFTYVKTGFFQSEQLFVGEKIDFYLKEQYVNKAKNILQIQAKSEKVFVHVRRGDYISEVYQGERGIDLPKQYFLDAIKEIEKNVDNPFYIFLTDDPEFVRCCFDEIENKFISEEDLATDLAIMSLCRYGIVSNSSFSWWGAYLAVDKMMMIFPKYWYGWKKRIESHPGIQPSWSTVIEVVKNENKQNKL
ncbi:hypothetical protein LCGC14_0881060 [marine sediment metagenome]|uniref:Glycosyl transferase family 11 n=1 Tax=marine sediment metagenome TaxID=412755 RepID=A0A0F9PMJ7_9ZZZZ|nr:alpha-1,2-fucosyltransferase [Methylophaga sp.]